MIALLFTLILDQLSKWWILNVTMSPPTLVQVTEFFNLVLVMNRGVSFGILGDAASWVRWGLVVFALALSAGFFVWMWRSTEKLAALGLGMIIGGALGNVIDRIRFGAVVDFLDFHYAGWHWPAFNVADAAIVIGVGCLIMDSLKNGATKP